MNEVCFGPAFDRLIVSLTFFFENENRIYLNDASNRIIVILVNFPFPIYYVLVPVILLFFFVHNQFSATFDFVWMPRVFQYFINAFRLSVRLSKIGLKWNPIIILDIGAKRNSYHRLVPLTLCIFLFDVCLRLMQTARPSLRRLTNSSQLITALCLRTRHTAWKSEKFSEFLRSAFRKFWGEIT